MLFGARGLAGLIRRYREVGHEARESGAPKGDTDENADSPS
jgi:hypothetical protein